MMIHGDAHAWRVGLTTAHELSSQKEGGVGGVPVCKQ
jgi:hypothetical protein